MERRQPLGFSYICLHAQLRPVRLYCRRNPGPAKLHSLELLHWCGACCKIRAEMGTWLDPTGEDGICSHWTSEGIRLAVVIVHLKGHLLANFKILLR